MVDSLEKSISPIKSARIAWRAAAVVVVLAVIALGTLFVLHYSFHVFKQVDAAATAGPPPSPAPPEEPRVGLVKASEHVKVLDAEIIATALALKLKGDDMKTRTISREDDRREFDRLNNKLLEFKGRCADTVADYNANLRLHPQADLAPIGSE